MKYWDNLADNLQSLLRDGYCFLPPIKGAFPLDNIFMQCELEIGNRTYAENLVAHQNFVLESGISSILSPALLLLARDSYGYRGSEDNQYHVSRLVRPGDISEGYRGHFDSHLFTLVMPIKIPAREKVDKAGDLLFYPTARCEPRNEISNFAGKLNFKRYASKAGFHRLAQICQQKTASFEDSRPLLFLGRQTFHGNMPLEASFNSGRLTLLTHFFDPSPPWGIGAILRKIRTR
jgi:hypothetical protein